MKKISAFFMMLILSFLLGSAAHAATDSITLQKMTTIERWEFKLQADGTATRTVFGSPRFGTVDEIFIANITHQQFNDLMAFLKKEKFFSLKKIYKNPLIADGVAYTLTAEVNQSQKLVIEQNNAGPKNLQRIKEKLLLLLEDLSWVPK